MSISTPPSALPPMIAIIIALLPQLLSLLCSHLSLKHLPLQKKQFSTSEHGRRDSSTVKLNLCKFVGDPWPSESHIMVKRKRVNSVFSQLQSPYAITLKTVASIVFSLFLKLYTLPKCFDSFLDYYWERGGEMGIKRHNRKYVDYSALFSISFDPWILCFVLNLTLFLLLSSLLFWPWKISHCPCNKKPKLFT